MSTMSVLLVEDDPALGRLLQTLVIRERLGAEIVTRGDEALKAIVTGRHLAVVLDLMLPAMTGFEIIRDLSVRRPDLLNRIIVLTAVSHSRLEDFELLSSVWRVIRKPFELPELIRTLLECVATHSAQALPKREQLTRWLAAAASDCGAAAALVAGIAGHELELRATYGFEGVADVHFPLPLNGRFPLCVAVRTGRPVWLASLTLPSSEYPLLLPIWTRNDSQALAAVPLKRDGVSIGGIGWSFVEAQPFESEQRLTLLKMASACVEMISPPNSYHHSELR